MPTTATISTLEQWRAANWRYLAIEVQRLRLVLHRRVLWLRQQWQHDPLQNYALLVISDAQADELLTGEDLAAELQFYQANAEAAALTEALQAINLELAEQQQILEEIGTPSALEILVQQFGLNAFERHVLLLCLLPELDPAFEPLYAYIQDDITRKYVTPHLAIALFKSAVHADFVALDVFLLEAPLRRFQLVTLEAGSHPATALILRPLHLDSRIADYLKGLNRLDDRLTGLLRPMPPGLLTPAHQNLVNQLEQWLLADADKPAWAGLNLVGSVDGGQQSIATALAERVGLQLYQLDPQQLPVSWSERRQWLFLLTREAILSHLAIYLDLNLIEAHPDANALAVTDVIEHLDVCLIVSSQERWLAERRMLMVRVPKPDSLDQIRLWQQALGDVQCTIRGDFAETDFENENTNLENTNLADLVQQFDFGPHAILQAVSLAQNRVQLQTGRADSPVTIADLWAACREQADCRLESLAQRLYPTYVWEDLVLPDDLWQQLHELADQVAHRAQIYERWGFGAKLSRGRGINALFAGPSGTGKTMAAEVLANHLQLDLYRIDLSGVVSKYIGETEKNLRRVFDAADRSGAILFFDEADALFGKRTEVKDSHDRYANIEVNYLLQRMEDYRGLAILATNMKSALDSAFLRRLRFLVQFPFPDAEQRRRIWQKVFPPQTPIAALDYAFLSRLEITGGNIKTIAVNAAFLAAAGGGCIEMNHVLLAIRREYAKIDKLIQESEFGTYYKGMKS